MIIGITGIFGSGKTTVAQLFVKYGYKHINADLIGHRLLNDLAVKGKVVRSFGKGVLIRGKIDRVKLKSIVFYDYKALVKLNKIIHPLMLREIKSIIDRNKGKKIIVDGALLIETRCLKMFDKLIVVKVGREEQLNRVLKKGKYALMEIKNILKSQLSQKEKLKYASVVVDNSRNLDNTKRQVKKIIEGLK